MMCNIMKGHYCSSSYFEQYFYFYSFWLLYLPLSAGGLPEGKKPCSWNSCMTRARRWSRVLRRDEQGTRSKSPRRSSPSVPGWTRSALASLSIHLLEQFCSYCAWCYLSYLPCRRWRCLRRSWGCWARSCSWRDDGSSSSGSWGLLLSPPTLDTWHIKDEEREYGGKGE